MATTAEQIALLDARIAAQADDGVVAYTIGDRSFQREPLKDLLSARKALLEAESITLRRLRGGIALQAPRLGW